MVMRLEDRPPYVRFETRPIEDRKATIDAGHPVYQDAIFALITPRGSKDVHEEIADQWIGKMEQEVREERFRADWLEAYKVQLGAFKQGLDTPVEGTPLKTWPPIKPGQLRNCHAVHIFTVEDLANANEEALMSLGMGARALRDQALTWLAQSAGTGKVVQEMAALKAENETLRNRNESLEGQMRNLLSRFDDLEARVAPSSGTASPGEISAAELLDLPPGNAASPSPPARRK